MTRKKSLIIAFPSVFGFAWQFHHLQTVVRAELHALSAVNAHIRVDLMVEENGVYGTCFGTFAAADAEFAVLDDAAVPALPQRAGGACLGAGGRVTRETDPRFKSGGKAAGRGYADARLVP